LSYVIDRMIQNQQLRFQEKISMNGLMQLNLAYLFLKEINLLIYEMKPFIYFLKEFVIFIMWHNAEDKMSLSLAL
jgi:hypothetical protein